MIASSLFAALLPTFLSGPLAPDDGLQLAAQWARPLGAAYSRVTADANLVVTLYGDGEQDFVVALSPEDGSVRWRHALGPVYLGHDGSTDGGISTPALGEELVFALGPRGSLRALERTSGEARWSVHLVDDLGAKAPDYGFTTSPVLVDGLLIVQVGGSEGRNLCAFDAGDGTLRWSMGEGEAGYASPEVLELGGTLQLVVLNDSELLGVAPADGRVLWTHTFEGRDGVGSGRAVAVDDTRFGVMVSRQFAVFEVTEEAGSWSVSETMRTRELGGGYAQPVYFDGYFYGYRSSFLTCVDATTGRRAWKSRPPGGRGLTLVGDRLVVFGSEGNVVVVRATPEGYFEESRLRALEQSGYSWPTAAAGRLFVRDTEGIACLTLDRDAAPLAAAGEEAASETPAPFLAYLAAQGVDAGSPEAVLAFLRERDSLPIVADGMVHFVYRGDVEDVAVVGSMTGDSQADPLRRLPGTEIFHRSYPIDDGASWSYGYQVAFSSTEPDPANPLRVPARRGELSEVRAPGYEPPTFLEEPAGERGTVTELPFASEQLANERTLQVWTPPGYDASRSSGYPLLLVHDGPNWIEIGSLTNALDNLVASGALVPLVVVFVAPIDEWWFEAGGSRTEPYLDMLATELVPFLEERYHLTDRPAERALMGARGYALTAAYGVVRHPEVFGRAGVQSVNLSDVARHGFFRELEEAAPKDAHFYVDWNRWEATNRDLGTDFGAYARTFVTALEEAGCALTKREALAGHGWASWRSRSDQLLTTLFGAP